MRERFSLIHFFFTLCNFSLMDSPSAHLKILRYQTCESQFFILPFYSSSEVQVLDSPVNFSLMDSHLAYPKILIYIFHEVQDFLFMAI